MLFGCMGEELTLEQRSGQGEGVSPADTWEKSIQAEGITLARPQGARVTSRGPLRLKWIRRGREMEKQMTQDTGEHSLYLGFNSK